MGRRKDDTSSITVHFSEVERDFLDHLIGLSGVDSGANVVRVALWKLGEWYDVPMGADVFGLRTIGRGLDVAPAKKRLKKAAVVA